MTELSLEDALGHALSLIKVGRCERAEYVLGLVASQAPERADLAFARAKLHEELGDRATALRFLLDATAKAPTETRYWIDLGKLQESQGDNASALSSYGRAFTLKPAHFEAFDLLLDCAKAQGSEDVAKELVATATPATPGPYIAQLNYLSECVDPELAARRIGECASVDHYIEYLIAVCDVLRGRGRFHKAHRWLSAVARARPDHARTAFDLLRTLHAIGDQDAFFENANAACARHAQDATLRAFVLYTMNYASRFSQGDIAAQTLRWANQFGRQENSADFSARPQRDVPRLGYLADHLHPMMLGPLFRHHDRERFDITVYTNDDTISTLWPGVVRGFDKSHPAKLCEQIRADDIDILIDVAGTNAKRVGVLLEVARQQPAPIQATWVGCCNTYRLPGFAYHLCDAEVLPGDQPTYSERLVRLPVWTPWEFSERVPEVNPLPARGRGHVSFGSCNLAFKLDDVALGLWARVLRELPDATLELKDRAFDDPQGREWMRKRLSARGLPTERVCFSGFTRHPQFYRYHHGIDITLDTHPFAGGIGTMESLWMGVPVVTMRGDRRESRLGVSYLTHLGLSEWIADSPDDYVRIACALAANLDALERFRSNARTLLRGSLMLSGRPYAEQFEAVLQDLWDDWRT